MKKIKYFYLIFFLSLNLFYLPAKSDQDFEIGKDIFINKGNCSACHTLKNAGSYGQIGPNLNQIKPDIARVMNAVINGIGVMPAYVGELSLEEINAVSKYVSISAAE